MKKAIIIILALIASFTAIAQTPCSSVTTELDKFTGEIITTGRAGRFQFERITKGKTVTYFVQINSPGAKILTPQQGLIILLEGGLKISKPAAAIEVVYARKGVYFNKTRVELTSTEWELLKSHKITATRLYKNDADVEAAEDIIKLLNCF